MRRWKPSLVLSLVLLCIAVASAFFVGTRDRLWTSSRGTTLHAAVASWPTLGCMPEARVAAPGSLQPRGLYADEDIRQSIVDAGGGAWNVGLLGVTLSTSGKDDVEVVTMGVVRQPIP